MIVDEFPGDPGLNCDIEVILINLDDLIHLGHVNSYSPL